jgi:hypothetical protein
VQPLAACASDAGAIRRRRPVQRGCCVRRQHSQAEIAQQLDQSRQCLALGGHAGPRWSARPRGPAIMGQLQRLREKACVLSADRKCVGTAQAPGSHIRLRPQIPRASEFVFMSISSATALAVPSPCEFLFRPKSSMRSDPTRIHGVSTTARFSWSANIGCCGRSTVPANLSAGSELAVLTSHIDYSREYRSIPLLG